MSSARLELVAVLSDLAARVARGQIDRVGVASELQRLATDLVGDGQSALPGIDPGVGMPSKMELHEAAWLRVFAYWQRRLHAKAKPTSDRKKAVMTRLREGFTENDLLRAIDGAAESPHHQGENEHGTRYDDLTLICRSGSKVEAFVGIADQHGTPRKTPTSIGEAAPSAKVQTLMRKSQEALRAHDHESYRALQAELAALSGAPRKAG